MILKRIQHTGTRTKVKVQRANKRLLRFSIVICLLFLQACGFQLRGASETLAASYATLRVECNNKSNWKQCQYLRASLDAAGTEITNDSQYLLAVTKTSAKQRAFTLRDDASAAEYELTHSVLYRLSDLLTDNIINTRTVSLSRIYRQNASALLAKDREKEEIELAIDKAIIDTILREIANL